MFTVPQRIPGQDRDEAGAKYLMRRVLDFANGASAVYQDDGSAFHFMLNGSQNEMTYFSIDTRQAANQHLFSTVRVEVETDEGSGSGTAFFFRDTIESGRSEEFLVTNNHVVEKARRAHIVFHTRPRYEANRLSIEREKRITFDGFPALWTRHPDETIDLCAVPLSRLKERAAGELEQLFFIPMGSHGVPEPDEEARYPAVLTVAMIGYPRGLWDEAHNLPIFRRGTTASHPAVDFNGRAEVVIDMACFPGSSGSPVIFDDRNWFASAHRFLGVLHAGPTITHKGEIRVEPVPTHESVHVITRTMMHLGYVIKGREVLRLARSI